MKKIFAVLALSFGIIQAAFASQVSDYPYLRYIATQSDELFNLMAEASKKENDQYTAEAVTASEQIFEKFMSGEFNLGVGGNYKEAIDGSHYVVHYMMVADLSNVTIIGGSFHGPQGTPNGVVYRGYSYPPKDKGKLNHGMVNYAIARFRQELVSLFTKTLVKALVSEVGKAMGSAS